MDGNDLRIKLEHERGRFGMDEQDKSKFNLGCTDRGSRFAILIQDVRNWVFFSIFLLGV